MQGKREASSRGVVQVLPPHGSALRAIVLVACALAKTEGEAPERGVQGLRGRGNMAGLHSSCKIRSLWK